MSLTEKEFLDGATFWNTSTKWPADFHNSDYRKWSDENPRGNFTEEWWTGFLPTLNRWKATRNAQVDVSDRFRELAKDLGEAWRQSCEPYLTEDISTVTWEQVQAFPTVVAAIKPLKHPSPVFTSKFCHFLLPRVFPVVDNLGLGNKWPMYETYFALVQDEWRSTPELVQQQLKARLSEIVEATGDSVFPGFPITNKIVELSLIGRHHQF
jgi:hypothetical protein